MESLILHLEAPHEIDSADFWDPKDCVQVVIDDSEQVADVSIQSSFHREQSRRCLFVQLRCPHSLGNSELLAQRTP